MVPYLPKMKKIDLATAHSSRRPYPSGQLPIDTLFAAIYAFNDKLL